MISLEQDGNHRHPIEVQLVLTMIWLKHCIPGVKQQSLTHSLFLSKYRHIILIG